MNMNKAIIGFLLLLVLFLLIYEGRKPVVERRWLSCTDVFDSILIVKSQNRGAFEGIWSDSIIVSSGYEPINSNKIRSISEIGIPFTIYKPSASDTLIVITDGFKMYFRIPCDMNFD
jgi:hypothetical protein